VGERPAQKARATMRIIATLLALLLAATIATGQTVQFRNTSSTLISAEGVPMSPSERFRFALFLGPSTVVDAPGITLPFDDPMFQLVEAYTTNSPLAIGAGYLQYQGRVIIPWSRLEELGFGSTLRLDFVVRGWSENAGTTWEEALANWNNGSPLMPMFIGTSTVGNDLVPSFGTLPEVVIFGTGPVGEIPGFNLTFIPEPSALALAILGGATLWASVRRRKPK